MEYIHWLEQLDTQVFLFLNGIHGNFFDSFMFLFSGKFVWIPFYASFLYVMLRNYPWRNCVACLLTIALLVVLCDQTASGLLKPLVARLRPSNEDNPISPLVHIVNGYRGGRFGFPSSHSANSWGLAFFAIFLVRNKKLTILLTAWALLMTYSRVYLGVHYPGDLLVGFIIGLVMAKICHYGFTHFGKKYADCFRWDENEGNKKQQSLPFIVCALTVVVLMLVSIFM